MEGDVILALSVKRA